MATIAEILTHKWNGKQWSMIGDDYDTLEWFSGDPKPTEAEIRQHSDETDQAIAAVRRAERKRDRLLNRPDVLLEVIDILTDFQSQLKGRLRAAALSQNLDTERLDALRARIEEIKNTD